MSPCSPRPRASEHCRCRYVYRFNNKIIAPFFQSLNIVYHLDSGAQPLVNDDETLALAVNGEIYNHRILRKTLKTKYNFKTHSDCEVIIPLVCDYGRYWIYARRIERSLISSLSVYGARA